MDPAPPPRIGARQRFETDAPEATEALAEALGRRLFGGVVLALEGEMGSGKTTFVRGLARGLGVEEPVTSPTFTLMQEHEGRLPLWHLDAWMAAREEAFLEAGGADLLGAEGVAVVEWAEHVAPWLPLPRLRLSLTPLGPAPGAGPGPGNRRRLELALVTGGDAGRSAPRSQALAARLEGLLEALQGDAGGLEGVRRLPVEEA